MLLRLKIFIVFFILEILFSDFWLRMVFIVGLLVWVYLFMVMLV